MNLCLNEKSRIILPSPDFLEPIKCNSSTLLLQIRISDKNENEERNFVQKDMMVFVNLLFISTTAIHSLETLNLLQLPF